MKILQIVFLVFGFLTLLMSAVAAMVIAGVGPGGLERAVGTLGSAIAGLGFATAGAMLVRPSRR
jgi:hypothetical protein